MLQPLCAPLVIVRKRSCPAVSQICSLTHFPSISTFLILKSILQAGLRPPVATEKADQLRT